MDIDKKNEKFEKEYKASIFSRITETISIQNDLIKKQKMQ